MMRWRDEKSAGAPGWLMAASDADELDDARGREGNDDEE